MESVTAVEQQCWGYHCVENMLVSDAGKREQHYQLLLLGDLGEDQVLEQGEVRQLVQLFGDREDLELSNFNSWLWGMRVRVLDLFSGLGSRMVLKRREVF